MNPEELERVLKFIVIVASISQGRAQGDQEEERGEVWLLVVFAVGLLSIAIVMVMLGAMLVRISRRGVRSREDEEDSKNQKKENEEKEDASKEEVSREETPSGRSVTFPVQHLEWVNGEWRVTITTDLDDQRRGEEEGRSEKGRSVGTRHGLPSSSSDVAPPSSAASKGQGKSISVSVP